MKVFIVRCGTTFTIILFFGDAENERTFDIKRALENPFVIFGSPDMFSTRVRYFDAVSSKSKISKESPVLMWTTHLL